MSTPTFCALPWVHRYTPVSGEAQVCCNSPAMLRDEKGNLLSGSDLDNQAVMNSPTLKEIRAQMLRGEWPKNCWSCQTNEKLSGGESPRLHANAQYSKETPALIQETKPDGSIQPQVLSWDFRLGNACNIACRMCSPWFSSTWRRDWAAVTPFRDTIHEAHFENSQWYRKPGLWEGFGERARSLRKLHFAGGEPMIVPQMIRILQACVDSGAAAQIDLSYHTNGTKLPQEVLELWPRFNSVSLIVSIDGYGPLNEYIRYPAVWADIDRNLKTIDQNAQELKIRSVTLGCTTQAYNVLKLVPLFEYASQFRHFDRVLGINRLYYPAHLGARVLPRPLKELAKARLLRFATEARSLPGLPPKVELVLNDMFAADDSRLYPKFLAETAALDLQRKQRLFDYVPEFWDFPVRETRSSELNA